jgi:Na+-transporting methylmalonyl-CoA/oxaloacetate decarboxylase gamma subunit
LFLSVINSRIGMAYSVQEMIVINEGLIIMGVGMLVVFAFLTIMVLSMGFMSNLLSKLFPGEEEPVPVRRTKAAPIPSAAVPSAVPIAVSAAIEADQAELAIAVAAAHSIVSDNSELAIAVAVAHSRYRS